MVARHPFLVLPGAGADRLAMGFLLAQPLRHRLLLDRDVGQAAQFSEMFAQIARSMPQALLDYVHVLPDHWRAAGVRYLSHNGYRPQADAIAAVNGCHAGIMAIMMTVSAPGDKIVFETGTYASIARSVALAGRRIVETPMDDDGILPDEFEKLCARQHPRLLYLMPAVNNPTLARLSGERRAAIVAICRRYNVWIIEDAIYAPLSGDREAPMAALCPELTFHVAGLSKTVSAALRSGWIACPSGFSGRIQSAHRMFSGGNSHVLKELASRVVLSGEADRILARALEVIRHRAAMLAECLDGYDIRINPTCPYAWLRLPEPWLSGAFRNAALERGIMISHEDDFKPSRSGVSFHAVRISFAQRYGDDTYRAAFATIRDLLESGVTGHLAVT